MTLWSRISDEIRYWRQTTWAFAAIGDHWDATEDYDEINEKTYSYFRRFIDGLRLSSLMPQGTVLDFTSRTGIGTSYFFNQGKISRAICMDVSLRMGEICRERLLQAGLQQFLWIPLNGYVFPIQSDVFDSIFCFETVEHFDRPDLLIQEMGRVIKPGGVLILTTPNVLWEPVHAVAAVFQMHHSEGPHRFIRLGNLRRYIVDAGFEIEALETTVLIPGGPRWMIRIGEWIERNARNWLMPVLGLRRVIVARKTRASS